jgi:hypothetical protein
MRCALRVASGDDQTLWLSEPDSQGVRAVVAEFKHAAHSRVVEHAQVAIDGFLRRDSQTAQHITIVDLGGDFCKP